MLTHKNGRTLLAKMERPFATLNEGRVPLVECCTRTTEGAEKGTRIELVGYNRNRRELFNHERLKDHVLWMTKHGSVEKVLNRTMKPEAVLYLRGVDVNEEEKLAAGHPFPPESSSMERLFEKHLAEAPKFFCRRWIRRGSLQNFPEITYEAVFSLEGDKLKRNYNPMLRRQRVTAKPGSYQVQERYGLWICKDYIPIQRKNEWITTRGQEYTKFHAFVNCQALRLTANRGSIENTPSEVLASLEREVRGQYNEIVETDDWDTLQWLEAQAQGHQTQEKEKKEWERRSELVKKQKRACHKGVTLVEPRNEQGVYALAMIIHALESEFFPFDIVDYETSVGIDVLAKTRDAIAPSQALLRYVEFKHTLTPSFNHSFRWLYGIVCWKTRLQHEEEVEDAGGVKRRLMIVPSSGDGKPTRYLLDAPDALHKIEVFVLEDFLRERLGLTFKAAP